ncbi:MAG: DUF3311 domain-containing protein [Candidatus Korobacteraceae bacterium]
MNRNKVLCFLLASAPFVAICFSVRLWDRVYPLVLGFPFNIFWLIAWIPLTSLCLLGVYSLRRRAEASEVSPAKNDRSR